MHWRRFATKDLPDGEKEFEQWLYDRFVEKDKMLIRFYEQGGFENVKQVETTIGLRHFSEVFDILTPCLTLLLLCNKIASFSTTVLTSNIDNIAGKVLSLWSRFAA